MKYVILRVDTQGALEFPVIFPEHLSHRNVAEALLPVLAKDFKAPTRAVSAGFMHSTELLDTDFSDPAVYGKSVTLNMESRPELDHQIIHLQDYVHGRTDTISSTIMALEAANKEHEHER